MLCIDKSGGLLLQVMFEAKFKIVPGVPRKFLKLRTIPSGDCAILPPVIGVKRRYSCELIGLLQNALQSIDNYLVGVKQLPGQQQQAVYLEGDGSGSHVGIFHEAKIGEAQT